MIRQRRIYPKHLEKYLKKPGCGILAVTKRVLSEITSRKAAPQTKKNTRLILSEKQTFVLINATRIIIETTGAKFTKNKSLAAEKLNTIINNYNIITSF